MVDWKKILRWGESGTKKRWALLIIAGISGFLMWGFANSQITIMTPISMNFPSITWGKAIALLLIWGNLILIKGKMM